MTEQPPYSTLRNVVGAYRLAHFDARGLALIDTTSLGAWRSFRAALWVLPANAALYWFQPAVDGATDGVIDWPIHLAVAAIGYVISWFAFPVLVAHIAPMLGREARFPTFLAAYNWSALVQMAIFLPATVVADSGALPDVMAQGLTLGVILALLAYQWFVIRATLMVEAATAAALVVLDLVLGSLINVVSEHIG